MAFTTATTTLKYSTTSGGVYTKLSDITNYPDMGSAPSKLDNSTLSNQKYKTNQLGLQEAPDFTFEANYDEATYQAILALTGTYWFHLEFGTSGANGIFEWSGQVSCYVNGAGVDEIRKMTIVTSMATELTES